MIWGITSGSIRRLAFGQVTSPLRPTPRPRFLADAEDMPIGVAYMQPPDVPRLVGRWQGDFQPLLQTMTVEGVDIVRTHEQICMSGCGPA